MPPEKGKLSAGMASPVGKCSSVTPCKEQEATPTPKPPPAPPGVVLTYKRKKGDGDTPQSNQEGQKRLKIEYLALEDDEHDEWQRVHNNLHEVIRSIVEPEHVKGSYQDNFWLSVLKCYDDPYGLCMALLERSKNKDGKENLQNPTPGVGDGFHSKIISVGTDQKLAEILAGRDTAVRSGEYKIPLDTISGKFEGVLYDVLTSGKFGLLCDIICENFQTTRNNRPVKMDFVAGFSSILSKVRKGSYDQSPELFEQDIEAILKKFMIIGRDMAVLAYGLSALTKYHIQKLKRDLGNDTANEKCNMNESERDLEKTCSSSKMNSTQIGKVNVGSAVDKCNKDENTPEEAMSSIQANNAQIGKVNVGSAVDKYNKDENTPEEAMSSIQANNAQTGGVSCGLAAGKFDSDENKFLLRFLTRQMGGLGRCSTAENCDVGEKIVEKASSLHTANPQIGGLGCDSAAEICNVGEKNLDKVLDLSDKNNQKDTNEFADKMNDMNIWAANVGISNESVPFTKSEQAVPAWLHKSDTCKRCGVDADGSESLICDGCDAMYHVSCTEPVIQESPVRSWYCTECSDKNERGEIDVSNDQHDCLHEGCVVCQRLKASEYQEGEFKNAENAATVNINGVAEHSLICEESDDTDDESPEPSRTAVLRLCKHCGTREEEDKRFLVCSHRTCHFKYYHIRCLNAAQLARKHQPDGLWYCPSCLCRACLTDKDDHLVCLCDRCDEAYHTYCMNPPRKVIPKGIWCCNACNKERIKEGMRRFEENILAIQVSRNDATKQSEWQISKYVKIEHEEHCENIEADRRHRKLSEPQLNKENEPGQIKRQLRWGSPPSQSEAVHRRQLKQSVIEQQQNSDINQQLEKNSITNQHKNCDRTTINKQKRSLLNDDANRIQKRKRSRLNGDTRKIYKAKGYPHSDLKKRHGRMDVQRQLTVSDMVEQPADKPEGKLTHPSRSTSRRQQRRDQPRLLPKCMTEQQINGELNENGRSAKVRRRNGNKAQQTNKRDVKHSMGPIGVLLDALDASEKMDQEAHGCCKC